MSNDRYARGFDDGFKAAVSQDERLNENGETGAIGYIDDVNPGIKKISIGFDLVLFDRINNWARYRSLSFSAAARRLIRKALDE